MKLKDIADIINQSTRIGISFHTSPDGDSLGSALALLIALKNIGKDSYILSKEILPSDFYFLPNSESIDGTIILPKEDTEVVIVLDCGNKERINCDLSNYKGTIINIDHHLSNSSYGHINYIDTTAAAVAEIVFDLIKLLGISLTKEIAECLYTSIMTDTGSFKYSNTTSKTHEIASELISLSIDFSAIHRLVYDNRDFKYLKLLGKVYEEIQLINSSICLMKIPHSILKELDYDLEDSSEIVSSGLTIKGVDIAILFKEVTGGIKISFRSKDKADVRKIAEPFGGGGHTKASGAFIADISIDTAIESVLKVLKDEKLC